jgi:hypothetical protein
MDNTKDVAITFYGPRWLEKALQQAADKELLSRAAYIRRVVAPAVREPKHA